MLFCAWDDSKDDFEMWCSPKKLGERMKRSFPISRIYVFAFTDTDESSASYNKPVTHFLQTDPVPENTIHYLGTQVVWLSPS